jgi:hypothetical protein
MLTVTPSQKTHGVASGHWRPPGKTEVSSSKKMWYPFRPSVVFLAKDLRVGANLLLLLVSHPTPCFSRWRLHCSVLTIPSRLVQGRIITSLVELNSRHGNLLIARRHLARNGSECRLCEGLLRRVHAALYYLSRL